MRIGKPILLVTTPVGVAIGMHEAWRLGGGGLLLLITAMLVFFGVGIATVVATIRREKREDAARRGRGIGGT
jgi:hypothetical protein